MSLFTTADIQALLTKYEAEGYRPFNAIAYAAKYLNNSQEKDAFATPLDHFREIGAARGYSPTGDASPQFFDAIFYAAKYPALGENGVIDAGDLFGHFLKFGVGEGRQASAYTNGFDSAKYLADYPGVAGYVNDHSTQWWFGKRSDSESYRYKLDAGNQESCLENKDWIHVEWSENRTLGNVCRLPRWAILI